jgi:8-oxo-dGTP pyrophosphatase MutT (NUDIX family)
MVPGGCPLRHDEAQRAAMAANLARFEQADPQAATAHGTALRRAAVCLIVSDDGEGGATLVLTRRAAKLNAHAGQWALPGGRMEAGETPQQAALREAREEIHLELDADAVLGRLDDYPTRSGYLITPVVAWAPRGAAMRPNPDEVAHIFRIPLALLRADKPEFFNIPESDNPVIRYPLEGKYVHAPTAAVMYQFMEVVVEGRSTRVAHLEQPVWAWK